MRIIIKPLGLVVLMTAVTCFTAMPRLFPPLNAGSITPQNSPRLSFTGLDTASRKVSLAETAWEVYADPGAAITMRALRVDSPPLKKAYHFDVLNPGPNLWSVGFHNRVKDTVTATKSARLTFWARATEKRDIAVVIQSINPPYAEDSHEIVSLTPEWQRYTADIKIEKHSEGEYYLSFLFGKSQGNVELGDIRLVTAQ
jgi:hypothetical protein